MLAMNAIVATSLIIAQSLSAPYPLRAEISENPIQFLLKSTWEHHRRGTNRFAKNSLAPSPAQMKSIKLIDSAFVNREAPPPLEAWRQSPSKPLNVILFILESTGSDYVFDTSFGNQIPMPFLKHMASNGLFLSNHYATSNTSTRSSFSLFTGLYPRPGSRDFACFSNASIPTLNKFLGNQYQCFIVTPWDTSYYFPKPLLTNNGLTQIYDKTSIPKGANPDVDPLARNEIEAVSFFLEKIDSTQPPFCGIYYSCVPHWPYTQYDGQPLICPLIGDRLQQKMYYNNLRLIDSQLERLIKHLEERHLMEDTVIVAIGDHGEAFGQHPGVYVHGKGVYGETYRTPAIFYQPQIFKPAETEFPTSHVDVLPTLLDAVGIPFDESKLQGESLLRGKVNRKYIFTLCGAGSYLSAIGSNGIKASISFDEPNPEEMAFVYHLDDDEFEEKRLAIDDFQMERDAVIMFRNYQRALIDRYNQEVLGRSTWVD